MNKPSPPTNFQSWLDYAVRTMDARGARLESVFGVVDSPTEDDIRDAALEELDNLRKRAASPWLGVLESWQIAIAERLGRSAEAILEANLLEPDFSDSCVRIQFEDGSDLLFRRAFYVGETPSDGAIHRVAVFTQHCGYHEFWLGPTDRISALANSGSRPDPSDEDLA